MPLNFPSAENSCDRIRQLATDEFRDVSIMAELLAFQAYTIDALADYLTDFPTCAVVAAACLPLRAKNISGLLTWMIASGAFTPSTLTVVKPWARASRRWQS